MQPEPDYTAHIRRLVDAAPPLTEAQRDRLATIFRTAPDDGAADQERREAA